MLTYGILVHSLPDWLPLPFKKTGLYGLELQKRMHYWPWEQVVKHAVCAMLSTVVYRD